ncbi:MAG: thrombospondin type 3 repeat-containing protein, partial [Gammaproteobacteria bacterium]|nr:thrombospondin type 3 repeat-containing protein [Gammaproteobacteria bacterium]
MSQRGPLVPVASGDPGEPGVPNPSSFPIKVDASGGFTQVLGKAPQLDGTVELSVGDDSFASPVQAGSLSGCPASWQSTVDVSGLPGGPNLLCARQVTNGKLPSASSCVTILIPDLDGDGVADASDNCVATANADQADDDGDSVGNVCDNCLLVANADQCNTNAPDADAGDLGDDNIGNVCDADLDNNGIVNSFDLNIMRSNFGAQGE